MLSHARALIFLADQLKQIHRVASPLRVCGIGFGQTSARSKFILVNR
jgi:hypothetical protein